jgi:hypothetical protein
MQSGCVVPAHDAVTAPPSDPSRASSPALSSEASLVDVVLPWPEALASLGDAALALDPDVPASNPPNPPVLALEPVPVLPSPPDALLADPLAPTWPETLPFSLHAANERHAKRPI